MKTSRLLLLVVVMLGSAAGAYFLKRMSRDAWQAPRVVTIESDESVTSLTPSWVSWLSDAVEGQPQALLLRDGDHVGGSDWVFRYAAADGLALKVVFSGGTTRLGDATVSVDLDFEEGRTWLRAASEQQLAGLRMVSIPDGLDAETLASLKRLGAANPDVDLSVESETEMPHVAFFRPRAVFLGEDVSAASLDVLANQPALEMLMIRATEPGSFAALPRFPRLRRLIIADWDAEKTGPLPAGLSGLRTLVVMGGDSIKNLSMLKDVPAGLEELSLLGLTNLTDISGLSRFTNLRTLILAANEKVDDLSSLASLGNLRWVGLPPGTTQEQFTTFMSAHPDLEILDLMGAQQLNSLAPLSTLKHLQGLVLDGSYANVDAVQGLTSLKFVGISKKTWDASPDQVAAIRKALPDAIVVRVSPFCLGSGWILLLVPVLALLTWLRRQPRLARLQVG